MVYNEHFRQIYTSAKDKSYPVCFCFFGRMAEVEPEMLFSLAYQRQSEFLPSLGVHRPWTFHILIFSSKTQMNWYLVGSIYRRRSFIKIAHFVLILYQAWPPQAILVFDWSIFLNILLSNRLARNLIGSIYRRSSIKIAHFVAIR
jgi:hypothetical protein